MAPLPNRGAGVSPAPRQSTRQTRDSGSGRFTQHKAHAFGREAVAILNAPIVGFGIRQAESSLVKKQGRRLQRLEAGRLDGLAAVVRALSVCAPLSRKDTSLVATTGR